MIIAGEPSGDLHASALMQRMKSEAPEIEFVGIGGDRMISAGLKALYHIEKMSFMGFAEVIKHIPFIRKVKKELLQVAESEQIKDIILIDYPGFNLNIARSFKKAGCTIFYYISPQVWAWGKGRIKKIQKLISKMLVVFPFEKDMYSNAGVDAEYVGHPLVERLKQYQFLSKEELCKKFGLDKEQDILAVFPGSRKQEVTLLSESVFQGAKKLAEKNGMQIVVSCAEGINPNFFDQYKNIVDFTVIKNHSYDIMKHSKYGIIKSGTSTLEAALTGLPMTIVYKTSSLTYFIGKKLVNVQSIGMANIIAGEQLFPELIQDNVTADTIYEVSQAILADREKYDFLKERLKQIHTILGAEEASSRAAHIILTKMREDG